MPLTSRFLTLFFIISVWGCTTEKTEGPSSPGNPAIDNPNQVESLNVTELTAIHRSGQTFLVWPETSSSANYHVYRHNAPITETNLSAATQITSRWGALSTDTSSNKYRMENVPANFIISDRGAPLTDNTGLFVYTIQAGEQGRSYYAVTTISGDGEAEQSIAAGNTLSTPVNESTGTPKPILTATKNNGKGRMYTQYMDYANWNPTFNGYAYNYTVALPQGYDPSRSYALQLSLHAYNDSLKYPESAEYNWDFIQLFTSDPGEPQGTRHTWWYGFASDHNYKTDGSIPSSGLVENFTEQRILAAVREVIADPEINVNTDLVHVVGNSMGASGALSLGLRYPNRFSGIYASEPMTNYAASPNFQSNFTLLWGQQQSNLQIVNGGDDNGSIRNYGVGGSISVGVWDWMNHLQQLRQRKSETFAYLMVDHGKDDTTIDWQTQGQPLVRALNDAKAGFSGKALGGVAHIWLAYDGVVKSMFGLGYDDLAPWRYPRSLSYPAIHNASGSSTLDPGSSGDDTYNTNIEWSFSNNQFHQSITDTSSTYEITIRSTSGNQTADITPRRTQSFRPGTGSQCSWRALRASDNQLLDSGTATAQAGGLITAVSVPLNTGTGTRLIINC